jgi:mono/diheme cytochrome c family protein
MVWMALALCASAGCAQTSSQTNSQTVSQTDAQPAATAAQPAAATINAGRKAYTSYCARCHGINLVSSSSAFYDLRTFPREDKERFVLSVNKGKRAMPAWDGIVKPEELEAIWAYVGSVNGWTTP